MSSRTLARLAGLAMVVGGVITVPSLLLQSFADPSNPLNSWSGLGILVGVILLLAGLPAYYATFARAAGAIGLVGYLGLFASAALAGIGGAVLSLLVFPTLMQAAPTLFSSGPPPAIQNYFMFAGVVQLIGGLAFGVGILVARAPERWAAVLLILGTLLSFAGNFMDNSLHVGDLGNVFFGLGLIWMGVSLIRLHAAETAPTMEREPAASARARS